MKIDRKLVVEQKRGIAPYEYWVIAEALPLDLKRVIGNFIIKLHNVDFKQLDCYEKRVKREKNPTQEDYLYHYNEEPVMRISSSPCYPEFLYKNRNLGIDLTDRQLRIGTINPQKMISFKSYNFTNYDFFRINDVFSPHKTIFAIWHDDRIFLHAVNNCKKLCSLRCGMCSVTPKIYFSTNGRAIWVTQGCNVYRYYFTDPTQDLLCKTQFKWREALLIGKIWENNAQYFPSIISKKSVDYYVYRGFSKEIRKFLKKYLNVKTKRY